MSPSRPGTPPSGSPPRVLLVSRVFPPDAGPTPYRWLRFVTGLVQRGWEVEVLTAVVEPSIIYYDEKLVDLIPPGVIVHRVNPGPIGKRVVRAQRLKAEAAAKAKAGSTEVTAAPAQPRPGLRERLRAVVRRTYETLTPMVSPDITVEWVPWAVRAGRRLLRQRRFDVVVSSSCPFSAHFAAHHIVKGSGIPWVGDYSDPFADNVFIDRPRWRKPIDRRFERAWLSAMDSVIVPVQEMADLFHASCPKLDSQHMHVIPYGYPDELYAAIPARTLEGFSIVHTGVFYPGMRDPTPMFLGMSKARELPFTLHHAGGLLPFSSEFLAEKGITTHFENHGFLPKHQVIALQKGAVCLVAVGNKGGHQLPGKLLDYLGARRPILMLRNDAHDIAADLVTATRTGLVVDNEPEAIATGIRQMYEWWRDGTLDSRFDLGAGREYSWGQQEERLEAVLRRYVRRGPVEGRDGPW